MKSNYIQKIWQRNPLSLIIFFAIFTRLIAVIFSKGFAFHDDHFNIIETPQSWVFGITYMKWFPIGGAEIPTGHNLFYTGIHYLLFIFFKWVHIESPELKMMIIRLIHASISIITVIYAYKIVRKLADERAAKFSGLLLAVFWFFPFLSVRTLAEFSCIPFMALGTWFFIISKEKEKHYRTLLISGFMLGMAFAFRYHTILFSSGFFLLLLLKKQWKDFLVLGIGYIISPFITLGVIDWAIWGWPFAELYQNFTYNIDYSATYFIGPWYNYILLISGILLPPISLFLLFGWFRIWKKYAVLFLPAFLFLLAHSLIPAKQERFILPIIPFILMGGIIGWNEFISQSKFWIKRKQLLKACWVFFWVLNLCLLLVISTMYSKRARVESMVYLSQYENIQSILLENSTEHSTKVTPKYYMEEWVYEYHFAKPKTIDEFRNELIVSEKKPPAFVLFFKNDDLDKRVEQMKNVLPSLEYEATIEPGLVDKILHWMNPFNANMLIHIYRNNDRTDVLNK